MLGKATLKRLVPSWMRALSRPVRRFPALCLLRSRQLAQAIAAPVKRMLIPLNELRRFYSTYTSYTKTGILTPHAYDLLPPVYMLTNGRLTDYVSWRLAKQVRPVEEAAGATGLIPALSAGEFSTALSELRRDGLYRFERRLDERVCDELIAFACRTPCAPFGDNIAAEQAPVLFDPQSPIAATYFFDQQTLAECPLVQKLIADPTALRLAQAYLGMEPILNGHPMWWSAPFKRSADARAAQLFHFDLDRSRFLKIFIYLLDVTEENGPHVYVRGTHHRKARRLIRDGRIPDEDIFACYPPDRVVTITGLKGAVFAEDTRGFHKGTPVLQGARLVFELTYVSDRYGRGEPVIHLNGHFSEELLAFKRRHPRVLCRYTDDKKAQTTADLRVV
jgi:hypothetical protein